MVCLLEPCQTSRERLTKSGLPTSTVSRSTSPSLEALQSARHEISNHDRISVQQDGEVIETTIENQVADDDNEEAFGDDFDDFEEGEEAEDFGDFGDQTRIPVAYEPQNTTSKSESAVPEHNMPPQIVSFPANPMSRISTFASCCTCRDADLVVL